MRQPNARVVMFCFVISLFFASFGHAEGGNDRLRDFYRTCILQEIQNCKKSADLFRTSNADSLEAYTQMKEKKAEFLDKEKDRLVSVLMEKQVEPKHYKVQMFLNEQFYNYLK